MKHILFMILSGALFYGSYNQTEDLVFSTAIVLGSILVGYWRGVVDTGETNE